MVDFSHIFGQDKDKDKEGANNKKDKAKGSPPAEKKKKGKSNPIEFSSLLGLGKGAKKDKGKKENIEFKPVLDKAAGPPEKAAPAAGDEPKKPAPTHEEGHQESRFASDMKEVYKGAIDLATNIFQGEADLNLEAAETIRDFVTYLVNCIKLTKQNFIECVFQAAQAKEINPYVLKLINVAVLAIEMGVALGYSEDKLRQLGMAAFLHDLGLKKYNKLIQQERKLTPHERKQLEQHPNVSYDLLQGLRDVLGEATIEVIKQGHERIDGTGYPQGLKGEAISECAQIIGLVDVYEALTHSRPYRGAYPPLEALRIILKDRATFNPRLTKVLLERIGLYPQGTYVELTTKEVAQVMKQNLQMPSSPLVRVVYDPQGKKVEEGRVINLAEETEIHITRSL